MKSIFDLLKQLEPTLLGKDTKQQFTLLNKQEALAYYDIKRCILDRGEKISASTFQHEIVNRLKQRKRIGFSEEKYGRIVNFLALTDELEKWINATQITWKIKCWEDKKIRSKAMESLKLVASEEKDPQVQSELNYLHEDLTNNPKEFIPLLNALKHPHTSTHRKQAINIFTNLNELQMGGDQTAPLFTLLFNRYKHHENLPTFFDQLDRLLVEDFINTGGITNQRPIDFLLSEKDDKPSLLLSFLGPVTQAIQDIKENIRIEADQLTQETADILFTAEQADATAKLNEIETLLISHAKKNQPSLDGNFDTKQSLHSNRFYAKHLNPRNKPYAADESVTEKVSTDTFLNIIKDTKLTSSERLLKFTTKYKSSKNILPTDFYAGLSGQLDYVLNNAEQNDALLKVLNKHVMSLPELILKNKHGKVLDSDATERYITLVLSNDVKALSHLNDSQLLSGIRKRLTSSELMLSKESINTILTYIKAARNNELLENCDAYIQGINVAYSNEISSLSTKVKNDDGLFSNAKSADELSRIQMMLLPNDFSTLLALEKRMSFLCYFINHHEYSMNMVENVLTEKLNSLYTSPENVSEKQRQIEANIVTRIHSQAFPDAVNAIQANSSYRIPCEQYREELVDPLLEKINNILSDQESNRRTYIENNRPRIKRLFKQHQVLPANINRMFQPGRDLHIAPITDLLKKFNIASFDKIVIGEVGGDAKLSALLSIYEKYNKQELIDPLNTAIKHDAILRGQLEKLSTLHHMEKLARFDSPNPTQSKINFEDYFKEKKHLFTKHQDGLARRFLKKITRAIGFNWAYNKIWGSKDERFIDNMNTLFAHAKIDDKKKSSAEPTSHFQGRRKK